MFSRLIAFFLLASLTVFAAATTTITASVSTFSFPLAYLLSESNYLDLIHNTHPGFAM
jgi:hypothetical protein